MSGLNLLRRGSRLQASSSIRFTRTLSTTHQEQALQKLNQNQEKLSKAAPPPPPGPSSSSVLPNGSSSSFNRNATLGIAAAGLFAGGLLLGKELVGNEKVVEYNQENKFRTPKYASVKEMEKVHYHSCLFHLVKLENLKLTPGNHRQWTNAERS